MAKEPFDDVDYSVRRYFVDEFYFDRAAQLPSDTRLLDLGGNRIRKRGRFDVERYEFRVIYGNLSTQKQPDVQHDAARIPFRDASFDAVICSELLEHVPEPGAVLSEVSRVLVRGGTLLASVPFLHRIHGDPHDYARYTETYWRRLLLSIGFDQIQIEKQGLFWSVLMEMLRDLARDWSAQRWPRPRALRRVLLRSLAWARRGALARDRRLARDEGSLLSSYTTGFGIVARRR